ncbi:MAG: DUF4430 domain-containing protein [Cellulosilyticaceae bacterium]
MKSDMNKVALAASLFLLGKSMSRSTTAPGDSIIFTITGPSGQNVILPETDVAISPGESVLDASLRVFDEFNLPYEIAGFGKDTYVLAIDNISQYEKGPESRWLYNIDGVYPSMSPAEYILPADARVEWIYTIDGGKDIGAPLVSFEQRNNNTLARK